MEIYVFTDEQYRNMGYASCLVCLTKDMFSSIHFNGKRIDEISSVSYNWVGAYLLLKCGFRFHHVVRLDGRENSSLSTKEMISRNHLHESKRILAQKMIGLDNNQSSFELERKPWYYVEFRWHTS